MVNIGDLSAFMLTLSESLKPFISEFAAFADVLAKVDLRDVARSYNAHVQLRVEAATRIAEKGWTVPPWITLPQFEALQSLKETEVDAFFEAAYSEDNFSRLNSVLERFITEPAFEAWHSTLAEVGPSIIDGRFRVTIPALLSIMEGYAVREVLKLTGPNAKRTNLEKLFEEAKFHDRTGVECLPWVSNYVFMQKLFARSDFTTDQPSLLNRHWVLHGRSQRDWILADALRLITALDTLSWAKRV